MRSRSASRHRSRRHRSRSGSRHRSKKAKKRRRRRRTSSSSKERSEQIRRLSKQVAEIAAALHPTNEAGSSSIEEKIAKLSKDQQQDIDIKAAQLNTEGSRCQFRCMAGIKAKVENLRLKIDDILVKRTNGPEDPVYQAVDDLKGDCQGVEADCDERIFLILKADSDPRFGWQAATLYEEQKRLDKKNPEAGKLFDRMLAKAKQAKKTGTGRAQSKPFRGGPASGRNRGGIAARRY